MIASLPFSFALIAVLAGIATAFNCTIPPIYVDIHKRLVHGTNVFQYGSFIGVGTPSQNHSLWPSLSQNETSFARSTYCDESSLKDCSVSTGGNFNNDESST
jgi:hypothetical protein